MNNQNLQSRVDDLWDHVEQHLRADDNYTSLLQQVRDLDDARLDGTLTEARLNRVSRRIRSLPRSYVVEGDGTDLDSRYWSAVDDTGKTNLQLRKVIHKLPASRVRRKGRVWHVKIGDHWRTFATKAIGQLAYDIHVERQRTNTPLIRNSTRDTSRDADAAKELAEYRSRSEARKEAIREVLRDNPGITMSEVLRRPEFDQSGEPYAPPSRRGTEEGASTADLAPIEA
jgi:hypothetical protein